MMGRGCLWDCVPLAEARAGLDWRASLRWESLNLCAWQGERPLGGPAQCDAVMDAGGRWAVRLGEAGHPTALWLPAPPASWEKTVSPSTGLLRARSFYPADLDCSL